MCFVIMAQQQIFLRNTERGTTVKDTGASF